MASILPESFPYVPKACASVSLAFFSCFEENGMQKKGESDALAGEKGLEHCQKEFAAYKSCVEKANVERKTFRVPEAYRVR